VIFDRDLDFQGGFVLSKNLTWVDFGLPADPFPEISEPVKFGGIGCKDPLFFSCYNPDEVVYGKQMREHLPFCGAAWHGKENTLTDQFGMATSLPILPGTEGEEFPAYELRFRAFLYMLYLLGIEYWAWHDFDMVPKGENLKEFHANIDRMVPLILELQKLTGIKCGWTTQNLFSFPAYCEGAATSPFVGSFALAWAQTKKMLEVGKKIGARNHVFWGGREGYNQLLLTLLGKEKANLARFLRMAVEYAKKIGFTAQFLIEPKPMEPTTRQYDASAEIVVGFLREFGLLTFFKLNLETNHALLAQLTMLHECLVATTVNMLGGIDANDGTFGNGWDTDEFSANVMTAFGIMYAILKAGGLGTGVINFDAHRRRGSFAPIDHIHAHILGIDTMAWGLRTAAVVLEDGDLERAIQARYGTWRSELGVKIETGKATPEEIAAAGYSVPFGIVAEQSSHHEAIQSLVLRAMMRAVR
jgi:xylose isomerase